MVQLKLISKPRAKNMQNPSSKTRISCLFVNSADGFGSAGDIVLIFLVVH